MKLTGSILTIAAAISLFATVPCPAQMGSAGINTATAKLFGDVKEFSAKCQMRMLDSGKKETMSMPADFALLDGKMRIAVDMLQMKSKDLPPEAIAGMKQMGMDKVVTIYAEKSDPVFVYPGIKSSVTMPVKKSGAASQDKAVKIDKTEIGKEKVDGHDCIKHKVTITEGTDKPTTFITWNATDLKGFPVQIQSEEPDGSVVMLFQNIQLSKPDAAQFVVPSDYKQYKDIQALQQALMAKMMGGAGGQ